jgi:hypothetical protein
MNVYAYTYEDASVNVYTYEDAYLNAYIDKYACM